MPVTGITERRRFTANITKEIAEVRLERGVTAALITGQAFASILTPIDTSFLINSQYRDVRVINGKSVKGAVGYTANYAAAVHERSGKGKGKPRANGNGNYWDPSAEPGFLTKGFEENKAAVDDAMLKAMTL